VGLGVYSAINEGKLGDKLSNILTLIAISLPEFFIAYLLIIFLQSMWPGSRHCPQSLPACPSANGFTRPPCRPSH
jgi:ABC-type dipeptide/oligopeptide/nickel transport system permease component